MKKQLICRVILCQNIGYRRTFHKGNILCRKHHMELVILKTRYVEGGKHYESM